MVPSSSGLGHLVLIQEIAGSNPAGITRFIFVILLLSRGVRYCPASLLATAQYTLVFSLGSPLELLIKHLGYSERTIYYNNII